MADHLAPDEPDPELDELDSPDGTTEDAHAPGSAAEPVLTRARYVQLVTSLLPLLLAALAAAGITVTVDQSTLLAGLVGAGGLVVAVVNWLWVRVQARRTRAVVTPVTDPRDARGGQLVSLDHAHAMAAEAAGEAAVSGQASVLPVGTPVPTPWDSDDTLVQEAA